MFSSNSAFNAFNSIPSTYTHPHQSNNICFQFNYHKFKLIMYSVVDVIRISCFLGFLFICFSLHACTSTARPLGIIDDYSLLSAPKDAKLLIMEKLQHVELAAGNGALSIPETIILLEASSKNIDDQQHRGENEIAAFPFQDSSQEKLEIKGSQKPARSMLESPAHGAEEEEEVNSNGDDTVEDAVVMDYAQPHKKPPIHNR